LEIAMAVMPDAFASCWELVLMAQMLEHHFLSSPRPPLRSLPLSPLLQHRLIRRLRLHSVDWETWADLPFPSRKTIPKNHDARLPKVAMNQLRKMICARPQRLLCCALAPLKLNAQSLPASLVSGLYVVIVPGLVASSRTVYRWRRIARMISRPVEY
jgi:hypothetical protein